MRDEAFGVFVTAVVSCDAWVLTPDQRVGRKFTTEFMMGHFG